MNRSLEKGISRTELVHSYGTPVVGETSDWWLNDLYKSTLEAKDILQAFENAETQEEVLEGQFGGGAGMTCKHSHVFFVL